jgi:hypothetical protein
VGREWRPGPDLWERPVGRPRAGEARISSISGRNEAAPPGSKRAQELYVPGRISSDRSTLNRAQQLDEVIWAKMHFARHLRPQALGEFTSGTELHRSDSLALVQLLILYHLLTARHVVSLEANQPRNFEASPLEEPLPSQAPAAM